LPPQTEKKLAPTKRLARLFYWRRFFMYGLLLSSLVLGLPAAAGPGEAPIEKGTVHFRPIGDQHEVPEGYRLDEHTFPYEMSRKYVLPISGIEVFRVRFPSPVTTPHPENNTVHAEYYRPRSQGPFPCVIVLDITGGDQSLSRFISTHLAEHGIGGLFVQMAYYGPRRPPGSRLRLVTTDIKHSLAAVRQTVLDMRRAAAWMAARPEVDPQRLGILGTSLGSFMGSLTAEMEPRLGRVAVLLGGGGLVDAFYDHPEGKTYRKMFETLGGSKDMLARIIAPADPLTCAANLKDRRVLFLAGKRDEIVPPKATEALWKASGQQQIVWFDCGHYTAAFYIVPAMNYIVKHFGAP
jgi:dienelactone hydrolase